MELTSQDLGKPTLLYVAQIPSVDPIRGPTQRQLAGPTPPAAFAVFFSLSITVFTVVGNNTQSYFSHIL